MRMWMVNPTILCRKHLLGEHGEIHKFRHSFVKHHKMDGRLVEPQIEPYSMQSRHDELAKEMKRRGMNHNSPYVQPDVSHLPNRRVHRTESLSLLLDRCPICKQRLKDIK
jgi:hypothetical protein